MGVTFENGVELHDFYVPAGADVPDPDVNPKFAHKLDFLRRMETIFAQAQGQARPPDDPGRRPERGAAGA